MNNELTLTDEELNLLAEIVRKEEKSASHTGDYSRAMSMNDLRGKFYFARVFAMGGGSNANTKS